MTFGKTIVTRKEAMKLGIRTWVLLLTASGFFCCEVGSAKEAPEEKPAASASEIDALVEQLKAESFSERQDAVARLMEIGKPALEQRPILDGAEKGDTHSETDPREP